MAAKGGGAWKVAYADFVTAMMAFFLVMWICGQDQKIRRAVAYYFIDPFGTSAVGATKKPVNTASTTEGINSGSVPQAESIATGRGRDSYTFRDPTSFATKLVSDWLHRDATTIRYWQEQARRQYQAAARLKNIDTKVDIHDMATGQLAKQLRAEIIQEVTAQTTGLPRDLLFDVIGKVNWTEIAEDLLELAAD